MSDTKSPATSQTVVSTGIAQAYRDFVFPPVKVKKLCSAAVVPVKATKDSAGLDLCSVEHKIIEPGDRVLVKTGLALAIPPGYEGQIRPRSGLALKQGITVLNAPGTIDADYRGEVGVILVNHGHVPFNVYMGDRIAQLVLARVEPNRFVEVEDLDETARGAGGFGSTGQ